MFTYAGMSRIQIKNTLMKCEKQKKRGRKRGVCSKRQEGGGESFHEEIQ